jgi:hypothetical protein
VDGAICIPKSVNTSQIGSTPNRFLYCVMNSTSVAVEGRAPSRRKLLCGIPHNDFYADLAVMPTVGRVGGGRGWSGRVAAGDTVGIIAVL